MRPLSQDHYYYTIPLIDINGEANRQDEPQRGPVINQKIYYTKFHEVVSFYFGVSWQSPQKCSLYYRFSYGTCIMHNIAKLENHCFEIYID